MSGSELPQPAVSAESQPFWEAARRGELVLQRCRECGRLQHYPRGVCAHCWSDRLEWTRASGRGRIYSFTVTYRTQARGFRDRLPYVVAWIELEEGVQMLANVIAEDPERLAIGMPVQVRFEPRGPDVRVPCFAPIA